MSIYAIFMASFKHRAFTWSYRSSIYRVHCYGDTYISVPPCWKETNRWKKRLNTLINKNSLRKFQSLLADLQPPACNRDGFFKVLQCRHIVCNCVDRYGKSIAQFDLAKLFGLSCPQLYRPLTPS